MISSLNNKLLILSLLSITLLSCMKDDDLPEQPPIPLHDESLITTIKLYFTDTSNAANAFDVSYHDDDGPGGEEAHADTIHLDTGKVYRMQISFWHEEEQIEKDALEHTLCFVAVNGLTQINRTDTVEGLVSGFESRWTAGAPGIDEVQIQLMHQEEGRVEDCSSGELEADVFFKVVVQ